MLLLYLGLCMYVHAKLLQSCARYISGQIRLYYICRKLVSKENNETLNVNKLLVKLYRNNWLPRWC